MPLLDHFHPPLSTQRHWEGFHSKWAGAIVPLERIRMSPPPGLANVDDVVRIDDREGRHCELIDGILVEKAVGWYESRVAAALIWFLESFTETHDLGIVLGEGATLRVLCDQVRIPDVCFAYTGVDQFEELAHDGVLEGGDALPGFSLSLRELFARAGRVKKSDSHI